MNETRIKDLFEYNENDSDWHCYFCSNQERALNILEERPLMQGQLKEKHGRWKFWKRWNKRFFTLNGGNIFYFKKDMVT
jgi:protein melted